MGRYGTPMELTLGQAAKAAGRGRSTIHRALKNGTLSGTRGDDGRWLIDPSELARVFRLTVPDRPTWDGVEQGDGTPGTPPDGAPSALAVQVELLTAALDREREALERERALNDELRADLRAERERVTALLAPPERPPERRRWWPWR